jgi:hypothetical protein
MTTEGPAVFALGATHGYGERVAQALGVPLAAHEDRTFEDGERKLRPLNSVRGRDTYLLHSLYRDEIASVPSTGIDGRFARSWRWCRGPSPVPSADSGGIAPPAHQPA